MKHFVRSYQQALALKSSDADYLLADKVARGDIAAFEELVEKYKQPVINFASRFLGDPIEAHDVAQNVFVQVFKLAHCFHFQSKFSTWLYAIARNQCRNEYRRRLRQRNRCFDRIRLDHSSADQPGLDDLQCADIPKAVYERELEQKIEESLASLPQNQRTAILLLQNQELSYEDVAAVLGTSVSATRAVIHRGRQQLKRQLRLYLRTGAWASKPLNRRGAELKRSQCCSRSGFAIARAVVATGVGHCSSVLETQT